MLKFATVDFNPIDTKAILDIHRYLMFGIIEETFIVLTIANRSNHTKCVPLANQKCMIQPTLINLHPNEYSQQFHFHPFAVKLVRGVGSWNILNDLFNIVCFPNKTDEVSVKKNLYLKRFYLESGYM